MGDHDRHFRRSKPQRELYRPGSGPLRKSDRPCDEDPYRLGGRSSAYSRVPSRNEEINDIALTLKQITIRQAQAVQEKETGNDGRKTKKPDTLLYTPRPAVEAQNREAQRRIELERGEQQRNLGRENLKQSSPNNSKEERGHKDGNVSEKKSKSSKKSKRKKGPSKDEHPNDVCSSRGSQQDLTNAVDVLKERVYSHNDWDYRQSDNKFSDRIENHCFNDKPQSPAQYKPPTPNAKKGPKAFDVPPRFKKRTEQRDEATDGGCTVQPRSEPRLETLVKGWVPPPGRGRGRSIAEVERYTQALPQERFKQPVTPEQRNSPEQVKLAENLIPVNVETPLKLTEEAEAREKELEERFPRKPSGGKLWSPGDKVEPLEESKPDDYKSTGFVLDWAAEVENCDELESLDDEPFTFAAPAPPPPQPVRNLPPPLFASHLQPPPLHQPPSSHRRHRRRSNSRDRGRNSRRNSVDFGSNNPSRNSSCERNWRSGRRDSVSSRHSSVERGRNGDPWINSLDRRRDRRSSERSGGGRRRRSSERSGGGGGGGRRRKSSERSGGGARRRSPERCHPTEKTNWRLEQRSYETSREERDKPQGIIVLPSTGPQAPAHRHLYNHHNPEKPIVVSPSRLSAHDDNNYTYHATPSPHFANNNGEQISAGRPLLYRNYFDQPVRENYRMVFSMEQADVELQELVSKCAILANWERIRSLRSFLMDSLKALLLKELKFCETENVEQHFWRILYYNIIELFRKFMVEQPDQKEKYKEYLLTILDEGLLYYEGLVYSLEEKYKVKFERVNTGVEEVSGSRALSTVAAHKLFLYLGDLARYRELACDTSNYGQARQWYLKANQMNPKNGRPYNQLALLAMYTGRKIDAVYYYMRTLIASSPLPSARESLTLLFDENRKKYEAEEKKKKEEKALRERERMREKEGVCNVLRREIWHHPKGGRNLHRTTSTPAPLLDDTHQEPLHSLPAHQLNKRFTTSYLHVIGKLFTKIGLETLNEVAKQMLREFRALLQHSPLQHFNSTKFIQIMALNMFVLEITQPKNKDEVDAGYRATLQESALVISLQMFNILLERFAALMSTTPVTEASLLPPDCLHILPAIKVWCDWLITHIETWNPPPSCQDFCVGVSGDCWERLAVLMNLLEKMEGNCNHHLVHQYHEGLEFICLPENATLCGFTPLMANPEEAVFTRHAESMELAQTCLRIHRLLYFGTVFLCGLEPPALKLHKLESGTSEYISIVETANSMEVSEGEVCIESESGEGEESVDSGKESDADDDVPASNLDHLIETRRRLETIHRKQLNHHNLKQRVFREREVMVEIEIRPKYLVPDTNCLIDNFHIIASLLKTHNQHPYIIMVPLIVLNELEGLSRGAKSGPSLSHAAQVREGAHAAFSLLQERHAALKPVTTRGHVLTSTVFTYEEDTDQDMTNDDKILATCLNVNKINCMEELCEGKTRIQREVVLLTEDRNLRLKALMKHVPVRGVTDFVAWAGLA